MAHLPLYAAARLLVLAVVLLSVGVRAGADDDAARTSPTVSAAADSGALGSIAAPPESWEGVTQRLARSLVDPEARATEEPLFLPKAQVRRFGRAQTEAPAALAERFDGWRVLGVEAFEYPSATLAADAAGLLLRLREREPQSTVPEVIVRALTPRPEERQAAEQTASRWLAAALNPARGDQVAVVMLWNPEEPNRPAFERLAFLLVKAGRLPDGRYRVQMLCHGTAQQAVLDGF